MFIKKKTSLFRHSIFNNYFIFRNKIKFKYFFHTNTYLYMKKYFTVMKHFSNFKSNELNQLKNTTLNKEPIISYNQTDNEVELISSKPSFYNLTDKVSCQLLKTHFWSFKGPFVAAFIKEGELYPKTGFIGETHTSCYPHKFFSGEKKKMNDFFLDKHNNNLIKTTLIPTDSKYVLSHAFPEKFFFAHDFFTGVNDNYLINFKNTNVISRFGDQSELLKCNSMLKNSFKMDDWILKGLDGTPFYLKNDLFEKLLIHYNIDYKVLDLDIISHSQDLNHLLPLKNTSFSNSLLNNDFNIHRHKLNLNDVESENNFYFFFNSRDINVNKKEDYYNNVIKNNYTVETAHKMYNIEYNIEYNVGVGVDPKEYYHYENNLLLSHKNNDDSFINDVFIF